MTRDCFQTQVERLKKTWGERFYPAERAQILWKAFSDDRDEDFVAAVEQLIATQRNAPLLDELNTAMEEARTRRKLEDARRRDADMSSVLRDAAAKGGPANRDFVKECLSLIDGKCRGTISARHFDEGLRLVEQMGRSMGLQLEPEQPAASVKATGAPSERRMYNGREND